MNDLTQAVGFFIQTGAAHELAQVMAQEAAKTLAASLVDRRTYLAGCALQGIMANPETIGDAAKLGGEAVELADAVIAALDAAERKR